VAASWSGPGQKTEAERFSRRPGLSRLTLSGRSSATQSYVHWHLLISIAMAGRMEPSAEVFPECPLSSSLNVQLTDALRKYVDERASDKDVYATPSEYIRDLIRQDMQDRAIALNVLEGLDDLKHGRFSSKSIRDFKDKD
jgi:antitoxin ParD1/3/4